MRVYELAKKLGKSSKEVLALLEKAGFEVSSHMSVLPDGALEKLQGGSSKKTKTPTKKSSKKVEKKKPSVEVQSKKEVATKKTEKTEKKSASKEASHVKDTIRREKTVKPSLPKKQGSQGKPGKSSRKTARTTTGVKQAPFQRNPVKKLEPKIVTEVTVEKSMPLFEVAEMLGKQTGEIILTLLKQGSVCNRNHVLTVEEISQLATQLGIAVKEPEVTMEQLEKEEAEKKVILKEGAATRWPIVVVMGHVDHGKTTLLDYIRNMNVALKEKGGITQHISAYEVESKHGKIVFLDTPGHEAFGYLRKRGSKITDIAILMVAADDGIKPQTIEALKHAKEAGVPIIVAINKMDKVPESAVDTVYRQLSQHDLMPEAWGGQTVCVPISAKTGQGVNELLEMIVLQAQMMELSGCPESAAQAFVLESQLEKGYGPVASVICTQGTLRVGDHFICGNSTGKVRLLIDTYGNKVKEVGPSVPVRVIGFNAFASSGDWLTVVDQQEYSKARSGKRSAPTPMQSMQQDQLALLGQKTKKAIKVIIKTDTRGSQEALLGLIEKLKPLSDEVRCPINILSTGIGDFSENDVELADSSGALLLGFHIKAEKKALNVARDKKVDVLIFDIIYKMIEYLEDLLQSKREAVVTWKKTGEAVVRKIFDIKGLGIIVGCYLRDGVCSRNSKVECVRNNQVLGEGMINSLQRERKVVKEIHAGYEFAFITKDDFQDWQEDDTIICYTQTKE